MSSATKAKLAKHQTKQYDVIIVGSGAAGLTLALNLPKNIRIAVLAKAPLTEASTYYAQGGIAAVLDDTDSTQSHIQDTLIAGAGICHEDAVTFTVEGAKRAVEFLLQQGVKFTLDDEEQLHLTQEGGHSHRRIIHAADATGVAVSTTLVRQTKLQSHIDILENYTAVDVVTYQKLGLPSAEHTSVAGIYALNNSTHEVESLMAPIVALACGGASRAYVYTSNPDIATGDGMAMAWRAGCRVANMEFNQFHPTCLYHPEARSFLVTEAMRGEGAYLRLPDGERFMPRFDPREELAPRDIVARAIDFEMKRLGLRHVYLDITHKDPEFIKGHFPNIYEALLELGIDITTDMIPVVPAAHYTCGGVMVDLHSQTDVKGLYAIGETSFTGLHGANRMASNSLLECFVFGMSAAEHITQLLTKGLPVHNFPRWDASQVRHPDEDVVILHNWEELRNSMWNYMGIVRTDKRLQRALNRIKLLEQETKEYYAKYLISNDLLELRNLLQVSELMVLCAMKRKESRGLHYTLDYPDLSADIYDTVLTPANYLGIAGS